VSEIDEKILDTDSSLDFPGDDDDDELSMWLEFRIDYSDLSEEGKKSVDEWKKREEQS
jgi:hypothetical protein